MNNLVLLTGATGFVGRHILSALLDKGCVVRIALREDSRLAEEDRARIHSIIYTEDFFSETESWLKEALNEVNIVIHAAWYVVHHDYLSSEKNLDCVEGTIKFANASVNAGVRRFIGIGTCLEYDLTHKRLSVNTKVAPKFLYSACKVSAYLKLEQIFKNKLDFLWCRLFFLYGPGENKSRLFPYLHENLKSSKEVFLTDGMQVRDYMDVRLAAKDLVSLALSKKKGVFNICSGVGQTIKHFSQMIADQYGRRELLIFGAIPNKLDEPKEIVGIKNY